MQRHPTLRHLSSEHHTGLTIARRARRAAQEGGAAQAIAWEEVKQRFRLELEGHFQREERGLLPVLKGLGEAELVERTLQEHEALRVLVAEDRAENLGAFADLLATHIRFEEQDLFETAQRLIAPQEWSKVAQILGFRGQDT
jgi:hemerythrin-like domain-containing protein